MAIKNTLAAFPVINAADVSGNITGAATNIQYYDNICIQVTTTGTPTGTLAVQGSNDKANWVALTPSPAISQPAGSATTQILRGGDLTNAAYIWIRLIYTASTGTGTLTALISAKAI